MSKITLDAETFKALASATRLTVLKALDERRKTLTELSHELELNKATVHEHLGLLLAAGLVRKRDDEGRKWIYYELTWTGQRILRPEATTTFNVLLALSGLAAGGGVLMLGRALDWWLSSSGAGSSLGEGDADRSLEALNDQAPESQVAASSSTDTSTGSSGTSSASTGSSTTTSTGSSTATSTGAQTGAAGGGSTGDPAMAQDSQLSDGASNDALYAFDGDGDKTAGTPFLDDGGWIALALVAAFLVFCALAFFLYRRLTPKPFDPEAAARAEAESGGSGPA